MIVWETGQVVSILGERPGYQEVVLELDEGRRERAIHYPFAGGTLRVGERVIVNSTAVRLGLGSGGYHFVLAREGLNLKGKAATGPGHLMKLRYTPYQVRVLAVEEEAHPSHVLLRQAASLEGTPVIVAELHSMLPALAASLALLAEEKRQGGLRVAYVMTDGGALPLAFSHTVAELKNKGLLAGTVTVGHAFGGDLEAVNLYSGLLAARHVLAADVIIVAMGPGIAGTGTPFGHTGVEQGQGLNAVYSLGGQPLACVRISFADPRERHRGLSHHTLITLSRITLCSSWVALPRLEKEKYGWIRKQIADHRLFRRHRWVTADGSIVKRAAQRYNVTLKTMGRTFEDDPDFFLACGAAAVVLFTRLLRNGRKKRNA